jgi:hypothetical protein
MITDGKEDQSLRYTPRVSKLPFSIPPEVIDWKREVFGSVNIRVSADSGEWS